MACTYNCLDLPNHEQITCGEYLKGGFSGVGILDCDNVITDFSLAADYTTAIDSGLLTLVLGIKGMVPEPTPVETPNPIGCGSETILDNVDRTFTWTDANVNSQNIIFYNELNRQVKQLILFNCNDDPDDTGEVTVVETNVNFVALLVKPESNKERQQWQVTAEWTKFDESPIFTAPTGIF